MRLLFLSVFFSFVSPVKKAGGNVYSDVLNLDTVAVVVAHFVSVSFTLLATLCLPQPTASKDHAEVVVAL